jgi:PhoPQ-activated pathogenicity-related protein/chitodextrinase
MLFGCPGAPNIGGNETVALIVEPTVLEFGATATELTFQVKRNYGPSSPALFRAIAMENWIAVNPPNGATSGPQDSVAITVTVDRSLLTAGTNSGTVRIVSEGASDKFVRVNALKRLSAGFTANELQPYEGDAIIFQDLSRIAGGGTITSWAWDFGDGTTSAAPAPSHAYDSAGSFDITLTVQAGDESATLTKHKFITVRPRVAPIADFSALETVVPVGSPVVFADASAPGTANITSWQWSFGDGGTAAGAAQTHTYASPGSYTVSLAVTSPHGQDEAIKHNYITVNAIPPEAGFTCSDLQPFLRTAVSFSDISQPGHAPIASWFWEFGDGQTSTDQNPTHIYEVAGPMTVSLTVADAQGTSNTNTQAAFLTVRGKPPVARFDMSPPWGVTIDEFEFTNASDEGTGDVSYLWRFGDGTESTEENPRHIYAEPGTYTVSLRAGNPFGHQFAQRVVRVHATEALDRYVRKEDPGISLVPVEQSSQPVPGGRWVVLSLVSQRWRSSAEVNPDVWQHWLALAIPDEVTNDTALLFISGGSTAQLAPEPKPELVDFAVRSGSVVAMLRMVPNQPTVFTEEGLPRTEDAIIAFTFDKYMNSAAMGDPDEEWPALLPMTKSAVRAMDAVQAYTASLDNPIAVKDFVVTGASKRGWTTWLTAAADSRVVGIAPMVIDMLNLAAQMDWHYSALCGYSEQLQDYLDLGVIARLHTLEGTSLLSIVDPYSYVPRLNIPKYGLNGTSDDFFVPDSAQFYYGDAAEFGSMHLRYFPNGNHDLLASREATVRGILPFYNAVVHKETLPRVEWNILEFPNSATLDVMLSSVPLSARLWTGTVSGGPGARDFGSHKVGNEVWKSTPITSDDAEGRFFSANVPAPADGWTGYFMAFEFPSSTPGEPHIFTTEVRCVPTGNPCYAFPGGSGTKEIVGEGSDRVTVVRLSGNRYQMGFWYGYLLADQIDAVWSAFSALIESGAEFPAGALEQAVSQLWKSQYFDTAAWQTEFEGIARGCQAAGHPGITVDVLKKIIVIPDLSEYNCSLFAAWGEATAGNQMFQLRNLDWTMDLGIQDYPVVAIYDPDDGLKHAVIGFAGLVGIAGGGMNEQGIAVSEIMGYFCDEEYLAGIPFPVLLRDVLYHDRTLTEALTRMQNATRTNQYHYCVGDPNAEDPKARLLFTSRERFDMWADNESVTGQHPCHPRVIPFHAPLNDAIYWKNHNGRDNEILYNGLLARYGTLDAAGAIELARAAGVQSTVLSIVYRNSGLDFWVAYANGLDPAQNQNYVHIELNPEP